LTYQLFPHSFQPTVSTATSQVTSQDQADEAVSQESNPEHAPQTPPSKCANLGPSVPVVPISVTAADSLSTETISSPVQPTVPTTVAAVLSGSATARSAPESTPAITSTAANLSSTLKEDDSMNFPPRRPSPGITELGIGRGIARGITSQASGAAPITIGPPTGNGSVSAINDFPKLNPSNTVQKTNHGNLSQQLISPHGNKVQPQQIPRSNDATSSESANTNENTILGGRVFSPPVVSGVQWRPQSGAAFQNQSEAVCTSAIVNFMFIDHLPLHCYTCRY
jgi:CCR4-NOT transcription complex subunit 3